MVTTTVVKKLSKLLSMHSGGGTIGPPLPASPYDPVGGVVLGGGPPPRYTQYNPTAIPLQYWLHHVDEFIGHLLTDCIVLKRLARSTTKEYLMEFRRILRRDYDGLLENAFESANFADVVKQVRRAHDPSHDLRQILIQRILANDSPSSNQHNEFLHSCVISDPIYVAGHAAGQRAVVDSMINSVLSGAPAGLVAVAVIVFIAILLVPKH